MKNTLYLPLLLVLFMACQRGPGQITPPDRAGQFAQARFEAGNRHYNAKAYPEAIRAYGQALTDQPHLTEAWLNRGNARFRTHDLAGAIADFDRLLAQNPSLAAAYDYRARIRYALYDDEGAKSDLRQANSLTVTP